MFRNRPPSSSLHCESAGFSMAEALLAMTIASVAGTAMLSSLFAAIRTSSLAVESTVAAGLAQQLMDEVAAVSFPNGTQPALPPNSLRSAFTNLDNFAGYTATPPIDRYGLPIGTEGSVPGSPRPVNMQPNPSELANYTQNVIVEQVQPGGPTGWTVVSSSPNYRRVTVQIVVTDPNTAPRVAAELMRVFSYVPANP